jgi:hypothetical protein
MTGSQVSFYGTNATDVSEAKYGDRDSSFWVSCMHRPRDKGRSLESHLITSYSFHLYVSEAGARLFHTFRASSPIYCPLRDTNSCQTPRWSFTLKMATAVFAKMLENFQNSAWSIPEIHSCTETYPELKATVAQTPILNCKPQLYRDLSWTESHSCTETYPELKSTEVEKPILNCNPQLYRDLSWTESHSCTETYPELKAVP